MIRLFRSGLLTALLFIPLPLTSYIAQAAEPTASHQAATHYRAVFQVSDAGLAKWNLTLTNAQNVQDALGKNNVDIEIIAYGPGIELLKFESELGDRIGHMIDKGIRIVACENTMKSQNLVKADMLPTIGFVPSGVVELIKKQQAGWIYVRP